MTQREEIWTLILEMCSKNQITIFTRTEFLNQYLQELSTRWSNAKTPGQTVSRIFQELRDEGKIGFLQRGVYKLLKSEFII